MGVPRAEAKRDCNILVYLLSSLYGLVLAASDASRSTGKGYQKLETAEPSDKGAETKQTTSAEKTEVTDTSDDSDTDEDSDSECGK